MLAEICAELKNWFVIDRYFGEIKIENGELQGFEDKLKDDQYFRLFGSTFSDGVYQYPVSGLTDETFDGAVWAMAVPPAVIALADEISAWQDKYASVLDSPYQSESFGGYSYSKGASGTGNSSGDVITWQSQFSSKLNKWRKIR